MLVRLHHQRDRTTAQLQRDPGRSWTTGGLATVSSTTMETELKMNKPQDKVHKIGLQLDTKTVRLLGAKVTKVPARF